jgi:hypothetical protein
MCKLSKTRAQQKLLPSQTEMSQMRRWPHDEPMPPKRKIEWCPMCPLWWKSSWELQGTYGLRRHTKGNIPTSPFETIHSSAHIKHTLYTQPGVIYAQVTKHISCSPTNVEQEPHTNQPRQQTIEIQDLKNMIKSLSDKSSQPCLLNLKIMDKLLQLALWNSNTELASAHNQTT